MSFKSNPGNAPASSGVVWKSQLFTANGTWNKPAKLVDNRVLVTAIGAGGSGNTDSVATNRNGGDGGEYVQRYPVDVSSSGSVTVTIGSGGAALVAPGADTSGNNGGATSFGSLVSVSGGQGGFAGSIITQSTTNTGGAMGGNDQDVISISGVPGLFGSPSMTAACGGGGLVLDDSGTRGGNSTIGRAGGVGYGAGGGAGDNASTTGAGADGALLVEWQEYA